MEIQLWRELLSPYQMAVDELTVKFRHVREEHQTLGLYSPIEEVTGRLKSITSIMEKMDRKHISMTSLEKEMEDLAGIRIICQFVEDIDRVIELIKERSDMRVKSEKDYLRNGKPSGYRSYHMIIYYTVNTLKGPKEIHVEIQIRTLAMNFWATVEHSLQYKYKENIPEYIGQKLLNAAEAIRILDQMMSEVRDEIMDAQTSHSQKEALVKDILNNIQNLYRVANKAAVKKIQDEFYKVYLMDDLVQLRHFAAQLDVISEGHRTQSLH